MFSSTSLLCLNLLVDTLGWSFSIPASPFLYESFGFDKKKRGLLESFSSFLVLLFGIYHGQAIHKVGKIRMLQISAAFQFIGQLCYVLAMTRKSLTLFLLAKIVPPIAKCATMVSQSLMSDISDIKHISENQGWLTACSNLAYVVGPLIGALYDYNCLYPYYAGLLTPLLNFIILSRIQKSLIETKFEVQSKVLNTSYLDSETSNRLWRCMQLRIVFQLNNILYEMLFANHIRDAIGANATSISLLVAYASGLSAGVYSVVSRFKLFQSPDANRYLLPLLLLSTVGLYGWSLSTTFWMQWMAVTVCSISCNLFLSITSITISKVQKSLNSPNSGSTSPSESTSSRTSSTKSLSVISSDSDMISISGSTSSKISVSAESSPDFISWLVTSLKQLYETLADMSGASLFVAVSSIDRFIRIITPILGNGVKIHCGGSVGLVCLISLVSAYCAALIVTILRDQRHKVETLKTSKKTL